MQESMSLKYEPASVPQATQRATTGCVGRKCPSFCHLIRGNPPISYAIAYRRVLCLIASGLFKMPAKSAVWLDGLHPNPGFFFLLFPLVTGPRRSLSLKLSDTRVYEPQIRARLGSALFGLTPFFPWREAGPPNHHDDKVDSDQ